MARHCQINLTRDCDLMHLYKFGKRPQATHLSQRTTARLRLSPVCLCQSPTVHMTAATQPAVAGAATKESETVSARSAAKSGSSGAKKKGLRDVVFTPLYGCDENITNVGPVCSLLEVRGCFVDAVLVQRSFAVCFACAVCCSIMYQE